MGLAPSSFNIREALSYWVLASLRRPASARSSMRRARASSLIGSMRTSSRANGKASFGVEARRSTSAPRTVVCMVRACSRSAAHQAVNSSKSIRSNPSSSSPSNTDSSSFKRSVEIESTPEASSLRTHRQSSDDSSSSSSTLSRSATRERLFSESTTGRIFERLQRNAPRGSSATSHNREHSRSRRWARPVIARYASKPRVFFDWGRRTGSPSRRTESGPRTWT